jgi:hypothetical protein
MKNNYSIVKEVIENYNDVKMLSDFNNKFVKDKNIDFDDYYKFCVKYNSDCSDDYYVRLNWKFIESGGDYSVFE